MSGILKSTIASSVPSRSRIPASGRTASGTARSLPARRAIVNRSDGPADRGEVSAEIWSETGSSLIENSPDRTDAGEGAWRSQGRRCVCELSHARRVTLAGTLLFNSLDNFRKCRPLSLTDEGGEKTGVCDLKVTATVVSFSRG